MTHTAPAPAAMAVAPATTCSAMRAGIGLACLAVKATNVKFTSRWATSNGLRASTVAPADLPRTSRFDCSGAAAGDRPQWVDG
jgi:hypothetical protein